MTVSNLDTKNPALSPGRENNFTYIFYLRNFLNYIILTHA